MSRRRWEPAATGTIASTSVGMFGAGAGYGLTSLTLLPLELIVGGITRQPRFVDGQVRARDVLNLTLAIDHDVIDGAPAARFGADLSRALETAAVLENCAADAIAEAASRH